MTGISKRIVAAYTADLWEHVCPIIRILEPLQAAGFQIVRGSTWVEGKLLVDLNVIGDADYVLIARDFPSRSDQYDMVIESARRHQKPVVYELDDLLIDLPSDHPDVDHYLPIKPGVIQAVIDADMVTVSTNDLVNFLKPFNSNIQVLPNYLIDRFWKFPPMSSTEESRPVTIGYMGGHGHKPDLVDVIPVLERILDKYGSRVEVMFWGLSVPDSLEGRENVRWTIPYLVEYEAFAQYFLSQSADIFIAPLRDNRFNRCKSALKYLEYSVFGIPGVYADLPTYRELITDGENGYLAATPEEWEVALSALIEDATLRSKVGAAAQRVVQEKHLLSNNAYRWKDAYQSLSNRSLARDILAERGMESKYLRAWYGEITKKFVEEKKARIAFEETLHVKENELQHMTNIANSLRSQIDGIVNSRGWKTLQKAYDLRLKLAPRGSKRERLMQLFYRSIITLRREGLRTVLSKGWNRITGKVPIPELNQAAEHRMVAFTAQPGELGSLPLVSIVVRQPHLEVEIQDVARWVASAAMPSCEIVVWDIDEKQAWKHGSEKQKFPAEDFDVLKGFLLGKYVCFASADLLAQNPIYLQTNVTALETESLAFTINISWNDTVAVKKLQGGELPGSSEMPLLRQLVAKEYVNSNLTLDLSNCTADAFVVGKFIQYETSQPDAYPPTPFQAVRTGYNFIVDGPWILGVRPGKNDLLPVQHNIHPVDTVLPRCLVKSPKPVIMVLIQFMAVGGAERLLLKLVEYLSEEFTFVIIGTERQASHLGTSADSFRKITPYVFSLAEFLNPALNFSFLVHLIGSFQPEALYIANGSVWIYDALSELKKCFPSLRMVNQVYDHQFGWINRYDSAIVSSLDAHISANLKISDAYAQKGAPPEQIFFIEHCIDMVEVDPARYPQGEVTAIKSRLGLPQGKKIVAFIARFHPQKRPMDFVELSRRCAADSSLHFLMVGEGPLTEVVEGYIRKNRPHNLTVIRFYRPITEIYAIMDLMVLPSEYEAMPLVVLEAQAMGKPVIVTDVGSNRDVVEDTGGGVVVPRIGDIKALSDGVAKVIAEPIDSAAVRNRIYDRFGTEKIAAQYRAAFLGDQVGRMLTTAGNASGKEAKTDA